MKASRRAAAASTVKFGLVRNLNVPLTPADSSDGAVAVFPNLGCALTPLLRLRPSAKRKDAKHHPSIQVTPSCTAKNYPGSHQHPLRSPQWHAERLLITLRPHARLEAASKESPKPNRPPIPPTRHSIRRVLLHALDDVASPTDPPHARRHESSAVERLCALGRGRGGGERSDGPPGQVQ